MIGIIGRYGYRWFGMLECSREYLRFTWLEISWTWGLAFALCNFGDDDGGHFSLHIHLGFPNIYLRLPFLRREPKEMMDRLGFMLFERSELHLDMGDWGKIIHLPWGLDFYRHSVLMADGTWLHDMADACRKNKNYDRWRDFHEKVEQGAQKWVFPYTYTLRNGEVQHRTATIKVEEWEHRRRCLKWTKLLRKVRRSIDVKFDDEVGERTGSWKGGTIGCGYEMLPDETPEQTLRRMERDRAFR